MMILAVKAITIADMPTRPLIRSGFVPAKFPLAKTTAAATPPRTKKVLRSFTPHPLIQSDTSPLIKIHGNSFDLRPQSILTIVRDFAHPPFG
jgi:hypothetical protein